MTRPIMEYRRDKNKDMFSGLAVLLFVAAVGCKTDGTGLMPSLADSKYEALLEPIGTKRPSSLDEGQVELVSSQTETSGIRDLKSSEDFVELLESAPGVVLVDFYADWCGPCRQQSKVLHDVQEYASNVNAQIIKVNVDEHRDLARTYKVASLPTLLVLKDGQVSETKTGYTGRKQIEAMLR